MTDVKNYNYFDNESLYSNDNVSYSSCSTELYETLLDKVDRILREYNCSPIDKSSPYNISETNHAIDYKFIAENYEFPEDNIPHIVNEQCFCDLECHNNYCSLNDYEEENIFKNAYDGDGLFDPERIEDSSVTSDDILDYYYDFTETKDSVSKKILKKIKACMASKIFSSKNISSFQKK